jgi:hypothetical protein
VSGQLEAPRNEAVQEWLKAQPKTFYSDIMKKIFNLRTKFFGKKGDWLQKKDV